MQCYYLMSFDQNMIIDATTGSIARFVNHSCSPNCRMIKWVVSGQPRMALFAGDNPIMTGEELTYDYNFDPFSAKNVQKCLCGSPNCRGVLGPKPREVKPPREKKQLLKGTVKTGKRKLKELLEGDAVGEEGGKKSTPKKRKIATATKTIAKTVATAKGVKRSLTKTSAKVVKGTAAAVKRGASSLSIKTKHTKTTTKTKTTTTATVAVKTKPQVKCVTTVPQSGKPTDAKTTIDTSVTTQKKASAATSGKSGVLKMYGKKGGGKAVKAMVKSASTAAVNSSSAPVISPSTCSTIVAVGTDQVTAADLVKGGGNMAASSSTTPPKRGEKTTDPMAPVSASTRASISPARKRTPSRKLLEASSFLTTSAGKKPLGVTKKKSPASSMKKGLDLALALAKAQEQE